LYLAPKLSRPDSMSRSLPEELEARQRTPKCMKRGGVVGVGWDLVVGKRLIFCIAVTGFYHAGAS
jgi:hypothetical protein